MRASPKSTFAVLAGASVAFLHCGVALAGDTAQSAMIYSTTPSSFVINQHETWAFDLAMAKTYYTNAWDGYAPAVTCTGGGANGCVTAPSTPEAPVPDGSKVNPIANDERCIFFDGGQLNGTDTYTQFRQMTVSAPAPAAQRGVWKFTFTYNISGRYVLQRTAWNLTQTSNNWTVPVVIDATLAGQSVNSNRSTGRRAWTRKYSFTLLNSLGESRVSDLMVALYTANADEILLGEYAAGHHVVSDLAYPGDDFVYTGNAGENGQASALAALAARSPAEALVSKILDGEVPGSDGTADDFPNNNSDVGFTAAVHKAVMEPVTFNVGPGCYTAKIRAVLKGVSGESALPISADTRLRISAGSCGSEGTYYGCEE